jgi:hypothetical protein
MGRERHWVEITAADEDQAVAQIPEARILAPRHSFLDPCQPGAWVSSEPLGGMRVKVAQADVDVVEVNEQGGAGRLLVVRGGYNRATVQVPCS